MTVFELNLNACLTIKTTTANPTCRDVVFARSIEKKILSLIHFVFDKKRRSWAGRYFLKFRNTLLLTLLMSSSIFVRNA